MDTPVNKYEEGQVLLINKPLNWTIQRYRKPQKNLAVKFCRSRRLIQQ
ncbi:MAG: hypothetical protein IPO53_01230 [Chitinophagaceae bacterium]|nr:hypothetical protein [Chitinophagaceae bacterium]